MEKVIETYGISNRHYRKEATTIHLRRADWVQIRGPQQVGAEAGIHILGGTHNVTIRHLRVRLGGPAAIDAGNNIDIYGNDSNPVHDIIIDHSSVQWGTDTLMDAYDSNDTLSNITFQWNIIAEGASGVSLGSHIGGYNAKNLTISLHHNLYANLAGRTPLVQQSGIIDYRNNIDYNWSGNNGSEFGFASSNTSAFGNIVNNVWLSGPDSGLPYLIMGNGGPTRIDGSSAERGGTKFYTEGNWGPDCPSGCPNDWTGNNITTNDYFRLNHDYSVYAAPEGQYRVTTPFSVPAVRTDATGQIVEKILASVGAAKPSRDAVDTRIVNEVKNKTGTTNTSSGGPWPDLASGAPQPPTDSDHDGMPDSWESSHGLNSNDPGDGPAKASNNYTNVENYLNELAGDDVFGSTPGGGATCQPSADDLILTDCGRSLTGAEAPQVIWAFNKATPQTLNLFYTDDTALTLGAGGGVSGMTKSPADTLTNPLLGNETLKDTDNLPYFPALFLTDISANPNTNTGDAQDRGQANKPNSVSGSWKANGVKDPQPNGQDRGANSTPWPASNGPGGPRGSAFTTEISWDLSALTAFDPAANQQQPLKPGNKYRIQAVLHDGQNPTAVGVACFKFSLPL